MFLDIFTLITENIYMEEFTELHFLPSGSFLRNTVFVNRQMYFPFNIMLLIIICQILE